MPRVAASFRFALPKETLRQHFCVRTLPTPAGQIHRTACAPPPRRRRGRLPACRTCRDESFARSCEYWRGIAPTSYPTKRPCTRRRFAADAACSRRFATRSPDADSSNCCSWHRRRGGRSSADPIHRSCTATPVGAPGTNVDRRIFSRYLPPRRGASPRQRVSTSEIRRYRDRSAVARAAARASLADLFSRGLAKEKGPRSGPWKDGSGTCGSGGRESSPWRASFSYSTRANSPNSLRAACA
jgi:hypothetical protein